MLSVSHFQGPGRAAGAKRKPVADWRGCCPDCLQLYCCLDRTHKHKHNTHTHTHTNTYTHIHTHKTLRCCCMTSHHHHISAKEDQALQPMSKICPRDVKASQCQEMSRYKSKAISQESELLSNTAVDTDRCAKRWLHIHTLCLTFLSSAPPLLLVSPSPSLELLIIPSVDSSLSLCASST